MVTIIDIAGLIGAFVGILTINRYELPYRLPPIDGLVRALTEKGATEQDRRHLIAVGGLLMFGVGTMLQIFSTAMR